MICLVSFSGSVIQSHTDLTLNCRYQLFSFFYWSHPWAIPFFPIQEMRVSEINFYSAKFESSFFFFREKLFKIFLFWLCWAFVAALGLSLVAVSGGYSSLWCTGFSLWWLLLLRSMGSRCTGFSNCGSRALERRLSSCGTRA